MTRTLIALVWLLGAGSPIWAAPVTAAPAAGTAPNTCVSCHATEAGSRLSAPVAAHAGDVHARHGFSCVDCHGGNAAEPDKTASMAASAGYKGRLTGEAQVRVCAGCHNDAAFMRKYSPDVPVDQAAKYATSGHGRRLANGDMGVATCASCHGAHGIIPVTDPASRVHGGNANAACGSCHALFTTLFERSPHQPVFTSCVDCHGSHAIAPASDALIGTGEGALCVTCHTEADDPGFAGAAAMRTALDRLSGRIASATAVLDRARHAGLGVGAADTSLGTARDQLMLARTEIHGFNPRGVETVTTIGDTAAIAAEAGGLLALEELAFRRRGLTVSLVLILGVVVALTLKIRQLDRRRAAAS